MKRIAVLTVVMIVGLMAYYPFSPRGKVAARERAVERHAATLRARLAADPRFARVTVRASFDECVTLAVHGTLNSEEDCAALRAMLADGLAADRRFARIKVEMLPGAKPPIKIGGEVDTADAYLDLEKLLSWKVSTDPRFAGMRVGPHVTEDFTVIVEGRVATSNDFAVLDTLVRELALPVHVRGSISSDDKPKADPVTLLAFTNAVPDLLLPKQGAVGPGAQ